MCPHYYYDGTCRRRDHETSVTMFPGASVGSPTWIYIFVFLLDFMCFHLHTLLFDVLPNRSAFESHDSRFPEDITLKE